MRSCPDPCEFKTRYGWCGLSACIRQKPSTKLQFVYVSDVVPVVRCRDCKFYHGVNEECGCNGGYHSEDWYCAAGERRDEDG